MRHGGSPEGRHIQAVGHTRHKGWVSMMVKSIVLNLRRKILSSWRGPQNVNR